MSQSLTSTNVAIVVAALVMAVLGLYQTTTSRYIEKSIQRILILLFLLLILYDVLDLFLDDYLRITTPLIAHVYLFAKSLLSAIPSILLTIFLLDSRGVKKWWRSGAFGLVLALGAMYVGMLVWTFFSDVLYYVDAEGVYHRGPLYPLLLVPPTLIMIVNLVTLLMSRQLLTKRQTHAFAACLLFPTIALVWQACFYGLHAVTLGTALGSFALFSYTHTDQTERYVRHEAEFTQLKTEVMLSQIQPHFLCNTLGAIGRLCKDNPEAKEAITKFSRYLRENVDALSQEINSPFERELLHAQTYLELEQLRFCDDIQVAYDITCTDFFLPTLTLQPLVENAVRHGIRGTEDGMGTVSIGSYEHKDHWDVVVRDDGAGFDPTARLDDGRTHVGLVNVAERLRNACGGKLLIDSQPGRGTTATIRIPRPSSSRLL